MFKQFLLSLGIQLKPSPPYKHSLNGVIKRIIQTVNKIARSILYRAKLPHGFWYYTTEHAVWLRNRLPTTALPYGLHSQAITSYEAYTGHKPDVLYVRIFACTAYSFRPKELRSDSQAPRIQGQFIYIGQSSTSIARLVNPQTYKEHLSADVEYHKYKFPKVADVANKPAKLKEVVGRSQLPQRLANPPPAAVPIAEDRPVAEQERYSTAIEPEALRAPIESSPERSSNSTAGIGAEKAIEPEVGAGEPTRTRQVTEPQVDGPGAPVELEAPVVGKRRYRRKDILNLEIFKFTRSGRYPKRTVFSDSIVKMVVKLQKSYIMPFEVFTV